ncbi:hypothetical protein AMTRI_Chr10g3950 [Amborella trichopoda]
MASNLGPWMICGTLLGIWLCMEYCEARTPRILHAEPSIGICEEFVKPKGYPCQEHTVITKDGFILGLQRIPEGRTPRSNQTRQPVLVQHGILVDGVSWLISPPEESLPLILADSGFDVWISNTRGTRWSRGHTTLNDTDKAFWAWSWQDLSENDLPAMFEYVQGQTQQKLNYVGHSLGTLTAMAAFSEGKLVDMVKSAALLSPIAHLNHITSPLIVSLSKTLISDLGTWLGPGEFNIGLPIVRKLLRSLCIPGVNCYDLVIAITGKNCCLNASTVELVIDYETMSTSTMNLDHLAQMIRNGLVSKYDYENPFKNWKHYGQFSPPRYNMSNIPTDLPLFLSYGAYDALSAPTDVELLIADLKSHNKDKIEVQLVESYAHVDFILGVNANQTVYTHIIDFFNRH